MSAFVSCSDLTFGWPDGEPVLRGLDLVVGPGRSGLVGRNGSGKSTLLGLLAGELTPQRGTVRASGRVAHLRQGLILEQSRRVDDVLGIGAVRRALQALERGEATDAVLAAIGDAWDVEERTAGLLEGLGLDPALVDRRVGELSGGETVLLGLVAQLLTAPDVLLLDEPTNNLDRGARARLYSVVDDWPGVLLVVSHDRELLERVDAIAELRDHEVSWYGGGFSDYEEAVAAEQTAAERAVRTHRADLRRQQRELVESRTRLDRRRRYGQKMWDNKREPKVVMGERKRQAQVSAAKHLGQQRDRADTAADRLAEAEAALRRDETLRVDLPATQVPAGRVVLDVDEVVTRSGQRCDLTVRGPERVALLGPNGGGKTTLLHTVAGDLSPVSGEVRLRVPARLLPQRLDLLDDSRSVLANLARFAPHADENTLRAGLARFLFRGRAADRRAATLSGGERLRASLAMLLLAEPAPQLLLLDEPTNDLDLVGTRQLAAALRGYAGAVIVASHDVPFLREIAPTRWLRLDGEVTETGPQ